MDTMEEIRKNYIQSMIDEEKKELSDNAEKIDKFKVLCAKKGINLSDKNFRYIQTIGIVASYPNLLSLINPKIKEDKEKLVKNHLLNT
jgi:hypothetical protein